MISESFSKARRIYILLYLLSRFKRIFPGVSIGFPFFLQRLNVLFWISIAALKPPQNRRFKNNLLSSLLEWAQLGASHVQSLTVAIRLWWGQIIWGLTGLQDNFSVASNCLGAYLRQLSTASHVTSPWGLAFSQYSILRIAAPLTRGLASKTDHLKSKHP